MLRQIFSKNGCCPQSSAVFAAPIENLNFSISYPELFPLTIIFEWFLHCRECEVEGGGFDAFITWPCILCKPENIF